ncbi:protein-ER retention protein [Podila clonocystis]|nr:protein-ER retention protein [Podila clonocystis]
MDIGNIFEEWDFSGTVPLPYRVLLMGCIGVFAWASNLHILAHLRVDVSNLLFSSPPLSGLYNSGSRHRDKFNASKSSPLSALYRSIYTLGAGFLAMTLINMWMYKWVVAGSDDKVAASGTVDARGGMGQKGNPRAGIMVPILGYITIAVMIFAPLNVLFKKERFRFLRSMRHVMFSGFKSEVSFADVILADILTSFARVFGDLAVALCLMFLDRDGTNTDAYYGSILVPIMTSIPYCIRLRQCLSEYIESSYTTDRHLMNALKYASAFPVIIISSLQKSAKAASLKGQPNSGYFSDNSLFRLWLLFVAINSFYSFYWDIYHDWSLIQVQSTSRNSPLVNNVPTGASSTTGSSHPRLSSGPLSPSASKSGSLCINDSSLGAASMNSPSVSNGSAHNSSSNSGKKQSTPSQHHRQEHHVQSRRFGMRSFLHYEDPAFYYMAVILDFLLRTTWMLKLVSNIQIEEYEGGVFTMECLEVLRRWIWVIFRMESEMVKRSGYSDSGPMSAGLGSSGSGVAGGDMESQDGSNVILMEDLESWQK